MLFIYAACTGDFTGQWAHKNGTFEDLGRPQVTRMCLDVKGNGTAPGTRVDL